MESLEPLFIVIMILLFINIVLDLINMNLRKRINKYQMDWNKAMMEENEVFWKRLDVLYDQIDLLEERNKEDDA